VPAMKKKSRVTSRISTARGNSSRDQADQDLRKQLVTLLKGGQAHVHFGDALDDFPARKRGVPAKGLAHTAWQLLEHVRIAQWDILEFSRKAKHASPEWPKGYWPGTEAPASTAAWNRSIQQFRKDLKSMQDLVADPKTNLYARIPWGDGQSILREALLLADHNAYHLGQLVDVKRLSGAWKA